MEQLGRLDIVVNNAGIGDVGSTLEETSQEIVERITRINQWGVFFGLKHAPSVMNDGGSIINTASLYLALLHIPTLGLVKHLITLHYNM